jgi:A/G-specific adenine glycosylase
MGNGSKVSHQLIKKWHFYRRDFLWRHAPSPYKIMIAEFMLQRTKAEQVEPVYKKFLDQFPDIFTLAKAREGEISGFTKNLGLHKRGKTFLLSSKYIVDHCRGIFPLKRQALLEIPGIGDYIAGALLTVCFNKPEYVIDSNIARFINRYWGLNLKGEIRRKKEIIKRARELFNYSDTRNLLFALLDFTALVCKPLKPDHGNCVLSKTCAYNLERLEDQ